jgi:hypothetical protein
MIVHLKKSKDFDKLYDEFEAKIQATINKRAQKEEELKADGTSSPPK